MGSTGRKIKRIHAVPVPEPREAPVQEPEREDAPEHEDAPVPA